MFRIGFNALAAMLLLPVISFSQQLFVDTTQGKNSWFSTNDGKTSVNGYFDVGYVAGRQKSAKVVNFDGDTVNDYGYHYNTTYPLYTNTFTLPYAYIMLNHTIENRAKFRLAFHAGHIPYSLYYQELGMIKYVREAAIWYKLTDKWSIDAGIFPSVYGLEVMVSKENLHATRGYIADFSPDYEAGIRLVHQPNDRWTFRYMALNGWQEIKDFNGRKALGFTATYTTKKETLVNYAFYIGDERPLLSPFRMLRVYHNLYSYLYLGKHIIMAPVVDYAIQERGVSSGWKTIIAPAYSFKYRFKEGKYAIAARYDFVYDPERISPELLNSNSSGWKSHSGTLTLEHNPFDKLTFRLEGRYTKSPYNLFYYGNGTLSKEDYYLVMSCAFKF